MSEGKCSTCGPGTSEEGSRKLAAQARILGSPCPVLECAREKRIAHCLRDCEEFPCSHFQKGPYPFGAEFLLMQERRRQTQAPNNPRRREPWPVADVHWSDLAAGDPAEICGRCRCQWDPAQGFGMDFLGERYWVHPGRRSVRPERPDAPLEPYLPLVLVLFLLNAQDRALLGTMVTEREIPGGDFFFRHLHRLPTRVLEEAFGSRHEALLEAGLSLGGIRRDIAPASFELLPLPRVPVAFHLWPADDEFPAKCTVTFDGSIHRQIPLDVIFALVHVIVERLVAPSPTAGE
jgi:hypothetical protein